WAALVQKAQEEAVEKGGTLAQVIITLSVNTADFNTTTGVPRFLNGARQLSARAVLQGGTQVATPSQTLIFNNVNRFTATLAVTGGFASAAGSVGAGTGLTYRRGGLSFTVLPVIYAPGVTMASGSVIFGGCSAGGARTATLTAPAAGSSAWTATMSNTAAAGGTNVTAYEFNQAICAAATIAAGETFVVNAIDSQGNTLFAGVLPSAAPPATPVVGIRLDNVGPGAPTFVANPNNRQNGWINATVGLTGLNTSATDNDWMANGAADIGVGGYTRMLRVGTGGGTVANANVATSSATPALPAPSATNTGYCGVGSATDALGNESALPASATACLSPPFASFFATGSQHLQFGVDIAAPTIAFSGGLASNARINAATVGGEFQVTVADTGAVGNSGMLGGAPVIGNVQTRSATTTVCGGGGMPGALSGGVCVNNNTGIAGALPLQATTGVADEVTAAYYTGTFLSQDAAGNQSATLTRVVVRDNVPVAVTNPAVPLTITGAFTASAFLNDDLSIRDYYWTAGFGTALIAPTTITLATAPTVVDAFNAATLTNTNFAINTSINTFLGLQGAPGGVPAAYVAGSNPLNAVNLFARDQTQPAYSTAGSPVAPTAPAAGIAITNAAPLWNFTNYVLATSNATICVGTAAPCGATPTSTTFSATATGTTATFPNPFSRVDYYAANATGADLVLIGSVPAGSATLVDNGATRVWTFALPMTASTLYTTLGGVQPAVVGPVNVYAFGVNAAGNVAIVSVAVAQTINP
ncbi:MAG: beta strand repeat-containing protein, partial [Gemmatimonadales bacterium]